MDYKLTKDKKIKTSIVGGNFDAENGWCSGILATYRYIRW